jgi:hypothetical protein
MDATNNTLKKKAVYYPETSVFMYMYTWHHDPVNYSLNVHIPKNNSKTSYSIGGPG